MKTKQAEILSRKDLILGLAIERYIDTVAPVSSNYIANEFQLHLSPATIRNVFAELEEEGFLTHPHTSAGRIPTQKGYRYYVDYLMHEIQLLEEEKQRIKMEYERESRELEKLIERTSQVVSDVTHYTSLVSIDGWGNKLYCRGTSFVVNYPDSQDLKKISNILVALDEKEELLKILNQQLAHKVEIYIGQELPYDEINSCSLVVSSFKSKEGTSGRIAVLGPTRMHYERVVSALDYVSTLMEEIL